MATLGQVFQAVITGNPPPQNQQAPDVNCPAISPLQSAGGAANLTVVVLDPIQATRQAGAPATVTCRWSISGTASLPTSSCGLSTNADLVTSHHTTATHTPIPPPHPSNGTSVTNPGVSTGAAAGLGVGLAILGVIIGAAAVWWFFARRYRKSQLFETDETSAGTSVLQSRPSQKAAYRPVTTVRGSSDTPLDFYLLDGTGDSEIISELQALGHLIKDHVENNYHVRSIRHDAPAIKETLRGFGLDERTQSQIATLSLDSRTRHVAIRWLLSRAIFFALDVHSAGGLSLLPPSIVEFVKALPLSGKSQNMNSPTARAFDAWRRLSVFLLHEKNQERTPLSPPSTITLQVETLQSALDRFLGCFVHEDKRARTDQIRNLEGVIRECVAFGYVLFSHPCNWRYVYTVEPRSSSADIVVMPGLERLSSRKGEPYDTPQVVVKPTTVQV